MRWNDILQLPRTALANDKRVPKTVLVQQAALTKREQKMLDKVKRLGHFATATKSTTHMLPRVDDERDIQSIIFLRCEMAGASQAVSETAQLLHKCFPNPTIILQEAGNQVCISVAITRKSLAEHGAVVIETIESTGLFGSDAIGYRDFLDAIAFPKLPQGDMLEYLHGISRYVTLTRAIVPLGYFPQCEPSKQSNLLALVKKYETKNAEYRRLTEERRSNDITLNESAKLRMTMKQIDKERNEIVGEMKELCHD